MGSIFDRMLPVATTGSRAVVKKPLQHDSVTRGRLAVEADCNIETIRYYERIGLMPPPGRSASGYRLYGKPEQRRLRFILRGRALGFSIGELRELLRMVDGGAYSCGEVRSLTLAHVADIQAKIEDLQRLETTLAAIAVQCSGGNVPVCPIVEALLSR